MMNDMWSDCKTQLAVETLKSMLITRVNVDNHVYRFLRTDQTKQETAEEHSQCSEVQVEAEKPVTVYSVATATATVSTVDAVNVENN